MKIGYNQNLSLVVYQFADTVSQFGLSKEVAFKICPELEQTGGGYNEPLDLMDAGPDVFNELRTAHDNEFTKLVSGYRVPKCAETKHVKELIAAQNQNCPVLIEYEDGYEDFSQDSGSSSNGLTHVCWVGTSTGAHKSLLKLNKKHDHGGELISFHGLVNVQIIKV